MNRINNILGRFDVVVVFEASQDGYPIAYFIHDAS